MHIYLTVSACCQTDFVAVLNTKEFGVWVLLICWHYLWDICLACHAASVMCRVLHVACGVWHVSCGLKCFGLSSSNNNTWFTCAQAAGEQQLLPQVIPTALPPASLPPVASSCSHASSAGQSLKAESALSWLKLQSLRFYDLPQKFHKGNTQLPHATQRWEGEDSHKWHSRTAEYAADKRW